MDAKVRVIAFYLPQFHPIPENDKWWGKGFTEWTNVTKAKPLFKGHVQPKLPADLGFYDLRVPEVREQQAQLAKEHGVEGFCYWHYWFGNKKMILERPFKEVLALKKPNFPFCLAWANTSWVGSWYGGGEKELFKQEYPGIQDFKDHFYELLPAFQDERYIRVNGKLLFNIMLPNNINELNTFIETWEDLSDKYSLGGFYFIGFLNSPKILPKGLSASLNYGGSPRAVFPNVSHTLLYKIYNSNLYRKLMKVPKRVEYSKFIEAALPRVNKFDYVNFPIVYSNWDNSARSHLDSIVFTNFKLELFEEYLKRGIDYVQDFSKDEKIVFIKSWNEWAEGNYLEPDQEFGMEMLRRLRNAVEK